MDTIAVRLTPDPAPEWLQAAASARAVVAAAGGATSAEGEALTAAERAELLAQLSSMDASAQGAKKAAREEKLEQRAALERENRVSAPGERLLGILVGLQVWDGQRWLGERWQCISSRPMQSRERNRLQASSRASAITIPHPLQEQQRSSVPFFAAFIGLFIALPVGIVLLALSSGYIDSLGPR